MEWNARPPLQWDWENITFLNPRIAEHGNILHPTNFQTNQGITFRSSNSAGDDRTTGGPFFELGQTSPKSSKSVSINSSSAEESRTAKFTLEGFEPTSEDIGSKKEFVEAELANTYATPETSTCSYEPMLSLKLGKQAYFENASAGNLTKPSVSMMESRATRKRCKNTPSSHCQVEGCNKDLSNVKGYYRKHRVCESHSKSPKVVIGGKERRFCQQCSRFHGISEFDDKKRSCRRRLSNHNARRRKPQSKVISLNPARLSSWDFERQPIDIFSDKLSLIYPRPHTNSAWESTFSSRYPQCVHAVPFNDISKLVPFKGAATKVLDAAQELQSALSLLSTDLRGPYPNHNGNSNYGHQTAISQWPMNLGIQSFPFASVDSECWDGDEHHRPIESQMQIDHSNIEGNSLFQDVHPALQNTVRDWHVQ